MKKALEAGINFLEGSTLTSLYLPIERIDILRIMQRMLSAIDAKPVKPEPQGSVDWYELERIINSEEEFEGDMPEENYDLYTKVGMTTALRTSVKVTKRNIIKLIKDNQDLWLHTKPAIDPEIKRVYEKFMRPEGHGLSLHKAHNLLWKCIKAHCKRGE
jgi:hypothetical protein